MQHPVTTYLNPKDLSELDQVVKELHTSRYKYIRECVMKNVRERKIEPERREDDVRDRESEDGISGSEEDPFK